MWRSLVLVAVMWPSLVQAQTQLPVQIRESEYSFFGENWTGGCREDAVTGAVECAVFTGDDPNGGMFLVDQSLVMSCEQSGGLMLSFSVDMQFTPGNTVPILLRIDQDEPVSLQAADHLDFATVRLRQSRTRMLAANQIAWRRGSNTRSVSLHGIREAYAYMRERCRPSIP